MHNTPKLIATILCAACCLGVSAQEALPAWSEGTLDLHFIATGRGDASMYVLPDGTRILCDAGDVGEAWKVAQPNPSMTPGEWIAKYIKDFSKDLPGKPDVVDYFYLTHYHGDHCGTKRIARPGTHGYELGGVTMVGEQIHFNKIIDRQCETHSYPSKEYFSKCEQFIRESYFPFCEYQRDSCGTILENFKVGSRNQFKLVHNPKPYRKDFEIYNIAANGFITTGKSGKVRPMSSEDPSKFDENMFSCVFLMKYGKFSFYNGGDIGGATRPASRAKDRDFEREVADLIGGPVTMIKPDHHGWKESTNAYLLTKLCPQLIVVMCSQTQHPYIGAFLRMIDPLIYEGPRKIYFTTDGSRERLGRELGNILAEGKLNLTASNAESKKLASELVSDQLAEAISEQLWKHVNPEVGHIVVRVFPGGNSYQVFVLDAKEPGYKVLHKSEIVNL